MPASGLIVRVETAARRGLPYALDFRFQEIPECRSRLQASLYAATWYDLASSSSSSPSPPPPPPPPTALYCVEELCGGRAMPVSADAGRCPRDFRPPGVLGKEL